MAKAMQLMQNGDLNAATAAIQAGLGNMNTGSYAPGDATNGFASWIPHPATEGDFVVADNPRTDRVDTPVPGAPPRPRPAPASDTGLQRRSFTCAAGTREYRVYVPASYHGEPVPLVVMLHGCTQTPEDFARGTKMNALADQHGCIVAYPAQAHAHNGSNCWNWFKPTDQRRDLGEPAIIAGIADAVAKEFAIDRSRVYAAGLSAGAAMAVILGNEYPDVFAAVGIHSGLPYASAHDVPSAFAAMQIQGQTASKAGTTAQVLAIPVIVFHGDRDMTVTPANGDSVASQTIARLQATSAGHTAMPLRKIVEQGKSPRGRTYTRTTHTDGTGAILTEQWVIHGAGHAWSGGDAGGSYTDPTGPDASAEMLRFFLATRRPALS